MKIRIFAVPATIALTALGASACGQSHPTAPAQPTVTHSPTAEPSPPAPASAPVLSPGESAKFSIGSTSDSHVSEMTWTMGPHVVTEANKLHAGYQDIAFNLTIKNDGATAISDPTQQSYMVWHGTDGKTDNTLAHTAGDIIPSEHGIQGQNLSLVSPIPPNGYASGYRALLVPTSPGAVVIVDPNTYKPVLLINYDKLTSEQLKALPTGLQARRGPAQRNEQRRDLGAPV